MMKGWKRRTWRRSTSLRRKREHQDKIKEKGEMLTLSIIRTGSMWTRTAAYWSGKADDKMCQLCLEEKRKESACRCCNLLENAKASVVDLAGINPDSIANAMLIRVAPAMCGDPRIPFWGWEAYGSWGQKQRSSWRCDKKTRYAEEIEEPIGKMDPMMTARGIT